MSVVKLAEFLEFLAIWVSHRTARISMASWGAYLVSAAVWLWYGIQKRDKNIRLLCLARILTRQCSNCRSVGLWLVRFIQGAKLDSINPFLGSHADGCDPSHPVGFIEGWLVDAAVDDLETQRLMNPLRIKISDPGV